jgi:hypothetical protein
VGQIGLVVSTIKIDYRFIFARRKQEIGRKDRLEIKTNGKGEKSEIEDAL